MTVIGDRYTLSGVVTDIQDDGHTVEILVDDHDGYIYVSPVVLERISPDE